MNRPDALARVDILGSAIHAVSWDDALARIRAWAGNRESRYVCVCNVHSVVTAKHDAFLRDSINQADLAVPDGMPLVWWLRSRGFPAQERIYGPDILWRYCAQAERDGQAVYFYGSLPDTLERLVSNVKQSFPRLTVAGADAPPFRESTTAEAEEDVRRINASGAQVVFVGLGCPKQEKWMARHRGKIHAVMIGVGAAFDYHAGTLKRPPRWMQHAGLEWFYRLLQEPRRLWRRYAATNSLFVLYAVAEFILRRRRGPGL
jgi:N-acetylglucosaminyldiphosphoundecaprenol N-acetyl-beta-D-mannosaminyltransferase